MRLMGVALKVYPQLHEAQLVAFVAIGLRFVQCLSVTSPVEWELHRSIQIILCVL